MATIGVVVPAHDAAPTLARALQSIEAQTRQPDAVIVVDDHSHDRSADIARKGGVPVVPSSGRGPGAARNTGVAQLDTEYVAFLDADDVWVSDYLEEVHRTLDRHPCDLLGAGHLEVTDSGAFVALRPPPSEDLSWTDMLRGTPIQTSGVVVATDTFWSLSGFDEELRFSQDSDLWSRLLREGARLQPVSSTVIRTLRTTPETLDRLKDVEESRNQLMEKIRPHVAASEWRALRRARLVELARRYEYSGHTAQARRCVVEAGPSARGLAVWCVTWAPARARRLARTVVRGWRRRRTRPALEWQRHI